MDNGIDSMGSNHHHDVLQWNMFGRFGSIQFYLGKNWIEHGRQIEYHTLSKGNRMSPKINCFILVYARQQIIL